VRLFANVRAKRRSAAKKAARKKNSTKETPVFFDHVGKKVKTASRRVQDPQGNGHHSSNKKSETKNSATQRNKETVTA